MVFYECYNCGYNHTDKSKLISHLNRKTKCKSIRDDINLDECKKYILEGIQYGMLYYLLHDFPMYFHA